MLTPENNAPILEYDPSPVAILEPQVAPLTGGTPTRAVLCFFSELLRDLSQAGILIPVGKLVSEIGDNPLYRLSWNEHEMLVLQPGVGAPLAAGFLEEIISMGVSNFIVCGGCGVLDASMLDGKVFVVSSAIRDEGTSYHYLPPAREVAASSQAVLALQTTLQRKGLEYHLVKSWTTDAIFRETIGRRSARVAEGCSIVEMEAAALFAVACFRGVTLGQLLYAGDLVVPEGWDMRQWNQRRSERETLFWLSVEACASLPA